MLWHQCLTKKSNIVISWSYWYYAIVTIWPTSDLVTSWSYIQRLILHYNIVYKQHLILWHHIRTTIYCYCTITTICRCYILWHRYNTINFWSCKIMTIRPTSYIALRHHDCISNIWSWRITSVRPVTVIVPKWPFVQLLLFYNQLLILYWYWYIVTIWPRFDFVTRFDIMTMQETSDYGIGTTFTVRQTSHIGMRYKNAQQT